MNEVQPGETILDLSLQYCGAADAAEDIASVNDVAITDEVSGSIEMPTVQNKSITDYYASQNVMPATGITDSEKAASPFSGIGYSSVGYDFTI